jgi:hypothetical protein
MMPPESLDGQLRVGYESCLGNDRRSALGARTGSEQTAGGSRDDYLCALEASTAS